MFLMDQPRERCYTQLSLYCLHLASGHTLFCKSIKAKTVEKYLIDAADMIAPLCGFDPRRTESSTSKNAPPLQAIITEIKRWESVSDKRREPFTPAMLTHLGHLATLERSKHKDDELLAVLFDFFLCGLYAGFRQSEWSQDTKHHPDTPDLNKFGQTAAFTINDITFFAPGDRRVSLAQALSIPEIVLSATDTCWRTQKNNQNGEKKRFASNTTNPRFCYTSAFRRICQRFIRLRGNADKSTPLSVYRTATTGELRLVTANDVGQCMRYLAQAVYDIHCPKELQLFSAHSLRVGACVILHAQGFNEIQIQFILRWRSLAFMAYLRNLTALSQQQNKAFNDFLLDHDFPPCELI